MRVGIFSVICFPTPPRQQLSARRGLVSLSRHLELHALKAGGSVAAATAALIAVTQCRRWDRTTVPCGIRDVRGVVAFSKPSELSTLYGDSMLNHA
jgi:hypothetical protein